MHKSSLEGVYDLISAEDPIPLVFDSPHSGTCFPEDFHPACSFQDLEKAEDKYVDALFNDAPAYKACLLSAIFPRTYLDLNRAETDIDPELYEGEWPQGDIIPNPTNRSYAGIGLIRRLVRPGQPVYDAPLTAEEIYHRINNYYRPYHQTLEKLIEGAHYNYGQVWHINCHSMPSAASARGALGRVNPMIAPDFVLGDRDGTSCDIDFTHAVRDFFKSKGYRVAINDPYKGVELVKRYSAPATGRHSLQLEISRGLYLNEETYEKGKNYDNLKSDLSAFIAFCSEYVQSNLIQMAAD